MNPETLARERVTPELIDAFRRDGVVCIRALLTSEEVERLRAGIDPNLAAPSPRAKVASRPGDPGYLHRGFLQLAGQPRLPRGDLRLGAGAGRRAEKSARPAA